MKPNAYYQLKGFDFTRFAIATAIFRGDPMGAAQYAESRWGEAGMAVTLTRAAVAAGAVGSNWGSDLAPWQTAQADFMDVVRPATILGKLSALRNVPLRTRLPVLTGSASTYWVGELAPTPVSAQAFSATTLDEKTAAGIVVITDELARLSTPVAETLIRNDLAKSVGTLCDAAFIGAGAGSATAPAGILHGLTAIDATDDPTADLKALIAGFAGDLDQAVFVMNPKTAVSLSGSERPDIGARGGSLLGLPVITSESVALTTAGSPPETTGNILLIDPSGILFGDEGITVSASKHASVQMDGAPDAPPTASTVMVSLWQMNMVGLLITRFVNWSVARTGAVSYLSGANY